MLVFYEDTNENLLNDKDRGTLQKWIKSRAFDSEQKLRARIILMTADNQPTEKIMQTLDLSNPTLNRWRNRYRDAALTGC